MKCESESQVLGEVTYSRSTPNVKAWAYLTAKIVLMRREGGYV